MVGVPAEERFLKVLEDKGGASGNYALMEALGWEKDKKYWETRDKLVDKGLIALGKGRGGSVRIVNRKKNAKKEKDSNPSWVGKEEKLYPDVARVLGDDWARHERLRDYVVEITARQGSRRTGGTWTRPDVVVVSKKRFAYVPGELFDVWTFEVKPISGIDITGVFEAAAHAKRATRSYAMFEIPSDDDELEGIGELLGRCDEEAVRLGVGFITFTEAGDFSTWDIRVPAPRLQTDPELLEDFIVEQLSEDFRDHVLKL